MSVKLRVTLWYTLAMIAVSSIVLVTMNSFGSHMIEKDTERRVVQMVDDLSKNITDRGGTLRHVPDFMFYKDGVYMTLYDENHNIAGGSVPFGITEEPEFLSDEFRSSVYNGSKYYEFDKEIMTKQGKYFLKGIASVADEFYSVKSVTKTNTILSVITILIAAVGGYFIISRAFVPVKKISEAAEQISRSSDLSRRINIGERNSRDEIYNLANVFDKMLDKIEQTLEKEKQFTSDASHELRTPVAVILSECEYMEDCAKSADDYKESVSSVKRQAERMSKLISELLTISRMDRNTIQTAFEEVDISELLTFVCDEQEEIHDEKITLIRHIKSDITANADRFLLTRLFINLISNAYQYIGEGTKIEVSLTEKDNNIVFSVKDDGIGIAEENIPKIWERFYQADSARTSKENGSMGLGLSMVKWIAETHAGQVTVQSELNKGSTFTFTMPEN